MSRSVRISMTAARAIDDFMTGRVVPPSAFDAQLELRRAMEPRRKNTAAGSPFVAAWTRKLRLAKSAARRQETADIWGACWVRCGGRCECGCGQVVMRDVMGPERAELDHAFGRGKGRLPQSVETCWLLRADCHRAKTRNEPDAATWWLKFIAHCGRVGLGASMTCWTARNRLAFVEVRASLPAAPRLTP